MLHGTTRGSPDAYPSEVYELGFYGDEVLYALGYVMARAITSEQGSGAIGELIGLPESAFVERYIHLKGYGKSETMPALNRARSPGRRSCRCVPAWYRPRIPDVTFEHLAVAKL